MTTMTLYDWHGQNVEARPCTDVAPTVMAGYGEGGSTKPLIVKTTENVKLTPYRKTAHPSNAGGEALR